MAQSSAPAPVGSAGSAAAAAVDVQIWEEDDVRRYCDVYDDEMKGQSGSGLLFDFKDMHKNSPHFGSVSDEGADIITTSEASDLQLGRAMATLVQGMLLAVHLEGSAQEAKLSAILEGEKFESLMEHLSRERKVTQHWLRARFESNKKKEEARASRGGSQSIVFTSQPLPEVPADGKDHEPSVRLLQYKVLGAIRALPDTPAKNITSIRKALSKSTKLMNKAMTMRETLELSYHKDDIESMNEFEMLDAFLMKCQEGLNLEVMLEAQYEACKHIQQSKGESAADFAARAEGIMSLFEELLRGSGFTNDRNGIDRFATDRKRSQIIIQGLRPTHHAILTSVFSGKADKNNFSMVIGTSSKPQLISALQEADALVKTQQNRGDFKDPEWDTKKDNISNHKPDEDKKSDKKAKAEIRNLQKVDAGKKKHPTCGDVNFTKHDWDPGKGALGRWDPRGTQHRPCPWYINDGVCKKGRLQILSWCRGRENYCDLSCRMA